MSKTDTRAQLRQFVQETFLYMRPDFVLRDDTSLLQSGVLDSMGVMEVLGFLEETFGVVPSDQEITEANLGSLDAIAEFISLKQGAPPTP